MDDYIKAILKISNDNLQYRSFEEYSKELSTPQVGAENLHVVSDLAGNYGRLIFKDEKGNLTGSDWVAASAKKLNEAKATINEKKNGEIYFKSINGHAEIGTFDGNEHAKKKIIPIFSGTARRDSEYLLLNYLANNISLKEKGTLYLFTERIPCGSCTSVIKEFLNRFDGIKLILYYMYDHANITEQRSHLDFFNDVNPHTPKVYYTAINNGILNIVSVTANSPIHEVSQQGKQWRPKGVSSYAEDELGIPNQPLPHLTARIN